VHQHLFDQARALATHDPGKPRQANLRRAVSSAYYALFHALVEEACRVMFGASHAEEPFRFVLGRAFTHGAMKQACVAFAGGTLKAAVAKGLPAAFSIPEEIKGLAARFVDLQEQRHEADYDRTGRFRRSEVLMLVEEAESSWNTFTALPASSEKKFFLACLLTWATLAGR
jgi:uncharacterized protein (UPF0332 family)